MRSPASSPPARRWRAYAWGVLAALTCPCHLPVLIIVLAGTTAGAFLSAHWGIAAVTMIIVFSVSGVLTWRAVHSENS